MNFENKSKIYLEIIKEIVSKEQLEPQILSIDNSINSFSINIKNNKLIKIEQKSKGKDRLYFFGIHKHHTLNNIKSIKYAFIDLTEPNEIYKYKELIIQRYIYIIKNYEGFGCCYLYLECSDAKKCVHKDPFFALCCYYNKNLKEGKIFYGKNANNN